MSLKDCLSRQIKMKINMMQLHWDNSEYREEEKNGVLEQVFSSDASRN